jgi:hypothetical protein
LQQRQQQQQFRKRKKGKKPQFSSIYELLGMQANNGGELWEQSFPDLRNQYGEEGNPRRELREPKSPAAQNRFQ